MALFSHPAFMWASSFLFLHCSCVSHLDFIPNFTFSVGLCPMRELWQLALNPWGTDYSSLFRTYCKGPHSHALLDYIKFTEFQLLFSHWPSEISSEFLLAILGVLGLKRIPNSFSRFLWCRRCVYLVALQSSFTPAHTVRHMKILCHLSLLEMLIIPLLPWLPVCFVWWNLRRLKN